MRIRQPHSWLLGAIAFGIAGGIAFALPPVGERKYVLSSTQSGSEIKPESALVPAGVDFMKDPVLPGETRPALITEKKAQKRVEATKPKAYKPTKLGFNKFEIKGEASQPRVRFTRENLDIGRRDEPEKRDFLMRVFEDAER